MTQRTILTTRISGRPPSSSPRPKSARDFTRNNEQSRVRGGGRCAGLRPPPKLHRRICRMQLSRRLNETRGQGKESKQPSAQARTRRKAGTQAAVSSHACANASIDATRPAEVDRYCLLAPSPAGPIARSVVWRMPADSAHLHLVCSKISNVLKRLGFRSRTFFAQLLSETSRACTIRVRRSSLRRLWNDLGSHACLHRQRRRSAVPHSPTARPAPQPLIWSALRLESGAPFQGATFVSLVHSSATLLSPTTLNRYGKRRAEYAL